MTQQEVSLVLGTAGHIDHGKTTLVKALTGIDCDRLEEEKKRGITIELGFAPLTLPDERIVSIVDVPGHERFIRQMVAGASGIDAVMLIVAADEGVMPQTREHLAILELLGVRHGIVVVTKTDMVDEELLGLALDDIQTFVRGTFLESSPIVPVSAVSGHNMDALRSELSRLIDVVSPRPRKGPFFLPIDRAFPVSGFGTVITGTAYRGRIVSGIDAQVLPLGKDVRIRSVQVHGKNVGEAWAGQRVAACLNGVSVEEISRGDVVCAKGVFRETKCFDVRLSVLGSATNPMRHWQRVRVHIGTADVVGRVSFLDIARLEPGNVGIAQIITEENVVVIEDQRFVLRMYSPLETIAGGQVLFPYGKKPRGKSERLRYREMLADFSGAQKRDQRLRVLVDYFGQILLPDLVADMQETPGDVRSLSRALHERGEIVFLDGNPECLVSRERYGTLSDRVRSFLRSFHETRPYQPGCQTEEISLIHLRDLDQKNARSLLEQMAEKEEIVLEDGMARCPEFQPKDDDTFRRLSTKLLSLCGERSFQPPEIAEARDVLGISEEAFSSLVKDLREQNRVVIVTGGFLLSADVEERLLALLRDANQDITLAMVRDLTGSSRKFILPLLEYLDSKGFTRRVGEKRVLMQKATLTAGKRME
jgi:selenocysteine-specific elongation factor